MKFLEGDQVLAKLPSSDDFEKAKIINVRGSKYKVLFKGGEEHTLGEADVKAARTSRSQTRSRGRGGKSPSRKSPGRRSPARKSPARSPTLARKLPVRSARQAKISIARLEMPKDNSSDTDKTEGSESLADDFNEQPVQSRLRELGPITRRSIRIMSSTSKAEHEQKLLMLNRSPDRAVSLPVEKKSTSADKERGLSIQRDEDLLKSKDYIEDTDAGADAKNRDIEFLSKPQEWGGWIGALFLLVLLTAGTLLLQVACSNDHCSAKNIRIPKYKEWKLFLNLDTFLLYTGFIFFVAIISVLPIGRLIDGQQTKTGRLQYRINGIWALILSVAAYEGCMYQGYDIGEFLLKNSLPMSIVGLGYGALLAVILYIKGGRAPVANLNMFGSTHNIIYNFWQGREVNPRVGPLDIKLLLFRTGVIGAVIINLAAIEKIVKETESLELSNLNLAGLIVASLQIIYLLDGIIFESTSVTTFEVMYEGTGYMLTVGCLIYPYLATITTRYLLIHKVYQSVYLLSLFIVSFFVGYVIYRASNSQKDAFRKNPFSPSVSHLETIPTKRGKRLIVSGLWGHVRHPNYLGDILMHCSMACLSFATDILPYVLAFQVTLLLIYRALRDNARCKKRYGYAWEQYCSRVKYMILNRVF